MRSAAGFAEKSTRDALDHIQHWNSKVNALLASLPKQALENAKALDLQAYAGDWPGPLYGMTVSLKDNIDLAGANTTAASSILRSNLATRDATVVERLKQSGAIIIGKANLHEFAFGPTSQSQHFGPCLNPWDVRRVAGGSSGGSAVSVATGMCTASIGTDTAGSIRIPAAFNNIVGLRPTIGRISNRGSFPLSHAYDTLGPMACRVTDVARIFAAIAGVDEEDPYCTGETVYPLTPQKEIDISGLRMGVMRRFFFEDLDNDLADRLDAALLIYQRLGVQIVEIDLGDVAIINEKMASCIQLADAYAVHKDRLESYRESYGQDLLARLDKGSLITGAQYSEALYFRQVWRQRLRGAFANVDAILSPTTPFPAPIITDVEDLNSMHRKDITRYTVAWAFAGVPCLALPCGHTERGLPLGMQLTARWSNEAVLFKLGEVFQNNTKHHLLKPDGFVHDLP
ncbi:amidase [Alcaligenaceae bacterium CGII-47]|nr:amidase [Alcaligenaceae bacterium CGII-47]